MDVSTRQQMWKDMFGEVKEKSAELAGTYDMPSSPPKDKAPLKNKPSIQKTAGVKDRVFKALRGGRELPSKEEAFDEFASIAAQQGDISVEEAKRNLRKTAAAAIEQDMQAEEALFKLAFGAGAEASPGDNEGAPVSGEQAKSLPQATVLKPKVDTSGQEPPQRLTKKEAQHYAVPSQGRFPLDGYDQVKTAAAYFDEWYKQMPPGMRREFCSNLVKRASALSIPVSELAQRYGSDMKASTPQIKIAFDARRSVLKDDDEELAEVLDKLASAVPMLEPEALAVCLTEFDRASGLNEFWGGDIPDPYFSSFEKTAEKQESKTEPTDSIVIGNEYITKRKLVEFSKLRQKMMSDRFGEDLAKEFTSDPVSIFDSLPRDQKLVIMRMANTSDSPVEGASAS